MTRSRNSVQLGVDKLFTSTRSVGPNIRSAFTKSEYEPSIFYDQNVYFGWFCGDQLCHNAVGNKQ